MKNEDYDFDSILQELGTFGKYQRKNFILLSIVIAFSAMSLSFVFTTRSSNYRCYIPECDPEDLTLTKYNVSWLKYSTPFENNHPVMCQRYESTYITSTNTNHKFCNQTNFSDEFTTKCDRFVFETGDATIERDFNLTCSENMWKLSFVGSMGDFSEILGLPLIGYISDKFGRRSVMIIGCVTSAILGCTKSFLHSYEQFIVVEFFETLIGSGIFSAAYVIAIELVTPSHRVFCSTILVSMFSIGEAYLCLIAWWTESWRLTLRILYIPGLLFLLYYYHLNESVRWLLVKGKTEEAKRILKTVAKTNQITLNDRVVEKININPDDVEDGSDESIWKIFTSPILCLRFIFCAFVWLTCTFVFYGFNMKAVMISGNLYVNYLISVLIEVPANFICYWLLDGKKRKPVLWWSLLTTGVLCFLLLVLPVGDYEILIFSMGKCCITISLSTMYVYAAEVFPTSVRHSLLACCSIFGRIGGMAAPQIPLMAAISPSFVYTLFMTMTILSSMLILTFPESVDTKLPDTVSQAAAIGHKTLE